MEITQRDKVMLLVGASIGVIMIGIALEGAATYASIKNEKAKDAFVAALREGMEQQRGVFRGSADGSQTDAATERSSGGPTAVSTPSLARAASVKPDVLEPAYTHNGVPEELRVSE